MKKIASLLATVMFIMSCAHEIPLDTPRPPVKGDLAELSFMASMPAPTPVKTRSVGSVKENKVDNIYVLVFETGSNGIMIYKGKAKNVVVTSDAENENKITFKATLPVGNPYDYMVLANAEELLSGLTFSGATTSRRDDVNALSRSKPPYPSATHTTIWCWPTPRSC